MRLSMSAISALNVVIYLTLQLFCIYICLEFVHFARYMWICASFFFFFLYRCSNLSIHVSLQALCTHRSWYRAINRVQRRFFLWHFDSGARAETKRGISRGQGGSAQEANERGGKNMKGIARECVKGQICGGSHRRAGWPVWVYYRGDSLSLSSADESVIKHTDTCGRTHTHTHIIPTFLSTPTGTSSFPWKGRREKTHTYEHQEGWWGDEWVVMMKKVFETKHDCRGNKWRIFLLKLEGKIHSNQPRFTIGCQAV